MVDQSSNDRGHPIPLEQRAVPRNTWTDETIAALRAEAAIDFTDVRSTQLVAALDEMILLRRELTECRLGSAVPQAPASRKEALERIALAWRAYLELHLTGVASDAAACAALPAMWWLEMGQLLFTASRLERSITVLTTVFEGLMHTGVLLPGDMLELMHNATANAARKGRSDG